MDEEDHSSSSGFVTITANYVLPMGCKIGPATGSGTPSSNGSPQPDGGVNGVPKHQANVLFSFPYLDTAQLSGPDLKTVVSTRLSDISEMSAVVATSNFFFTEALAGLALEDRDNSIADISATGHDILPDNDDRSS